MNLHNTKVLKIVVLLSLDMLWFNTEKYVYVVLKSGFYLKRNQIYYFQFTYYTEDEQVYFKI